MPIARDTRTIVSGVSSVAKAGDAAITGAVTLSAGANITLTEVGNDIAIAAAGGGGVGTLALATVAAIANADILTLPTIAVQLVASPGPNKSIVPVQVTLRLARTADYGNINVNAQLTVKVGPDTVFSLNEVPDNGVTSLLAFGSDPGIWGFPGPLSAFAFALAGQTDAEVVDQPLTLNLFNGALGNLTGGDVANSLAVTVLYYVVSV